MQSSRMSNDDMSQGTVPSYAEVQRQIRQFLAQLTNCTYSLENIEFLQISLSLFRQQLMAFKGQSSLRVAAGSF